MHLKKIACNTATNGHFILVNLIYIALLWTVYEVRPLISRIIFKWRVISEGFNRVIKAGSFSTCIFESNASYHNHKVGAIHKLRYAVKGDEL